MRGRAVDIGGDDVRFGLVDGHLVGGGSMENRIQQIEKEGRMRIRDWSLYDGQHSVYVPKNMSSYELHCETIRAYDEFYSTPRIFGQFARGRIVPGLVMTYGRRVFRRLARVNKLFIEGLRNGANGSGGSGSGSDGASNVSSAKAEPERLEVAEAAAR